MLGILTTSVLINGESRAFSNLSEYAIITHMEKFITLKKVKRQRKHGFLARNASHGGQKVLQRRRQKARQRLTI